MQPLMTETELAAYLDEVFPEMQGKFVIEEVCSMFARVRRKVTPDDLRPGGTVSGPTMFGLADCAFYAVTLAMIGRQALTVTTNCSIDFMRKPKAGKDLIATGKLLKLGRLLAVGDVLLQSDGEDEIVARATLTYAIPLK